jgi:hypothetical protein
MTIQFAPTLVHRNRGMYFRCERVAHPCQRSDGVTPGNHQSSIRRGSLRNQMAQNGGKGEWDEKFAGATDGQSALGIRFRLGAQC